MVVATKDIRQCLHVIRLYLVLSAGCLTRSSGEASLMRATRSATITVASFILSACQGGGQPIIAKGALGATAEIPPLNCVISDIRTTNNGVVYRAEEWERINRARTLRITLEKRMVRTVSRAPESTTGRDSLPVRQHTAKQIVAGKSSLSLMFGKMETRIIINKVRDANGYFVAKSSLKTAFPKPGDTFLNTWTWRCKPDR